MGRVVAIIAPPRLGRDFRWLLSSSWVSNLGDGIAASAGPLLVASQTRNAFLVALARLLEWLPSLLFGLQAGALSDRLDRRRLILGMNAARTVILALLTVSIVTGAVNVTVVLVAVFLFSVAEVFADNTTSTLMPALVHRDDLAIANVRTQTGFNLLNRLVGPPIGALLFATAMAVPFAGQTLCVAAAAGLVSRVSLTPREPAPRRPMRHDIAEGLRWVWRHAAVRTLTLTILVFNVTFGAVTSVMVLYATRTLHMGAVGYGLLTTSTAVGGLLGAALYGRIIRRVSLGNLMRIGLTYETLTHLFFALNRSAGLALVIFFFFGTHELIWGSTSSTILQRATPDELRGRVNSVYGVSVFGGLVVGAAIGGVLAEAISITACFWYAFAGSALFVVLIWRQLRHVTRQP